MYMKKFLFVLWFAAFSFQAEAVTRCWQESLESEPWYEVIIEYNTIVLNYYEDKGCLSGEDKGCPPTVLFTGTYDTYLIGSEAEVVELFKFGNRKYLFAQAWSTLYKYSESTKSYEPLTEAMFCYEKTKKIDI